MRKVINYYYEFSNNKTLSDYIRKLLKYSIFLYINYTNISFSSLSLISRLNKKLIIIKVSIIFLSSMLGVN